MFSGAPLCGSWTLADLKACEIDPNNWEDAASDGAVERQWIGKKESRKQTWNVTRELKRGALAAKTILICPPPTSSAPCAVPSGDRHSRIGLHSYTSRCNTTTDWLGCTSFVSRYFVFQLHVLGPGRTDRAVAFPQTSFGVRYGETNGAEDWEGTFSSRGGTAVFADW